MTYYQPTSEPLRNRDIAVYQRRARRNATWAVRSLEAAEYFAGFNPVRSLEYRAEAVHWQLAAAAEATIARLNLLRLIND